MRYLCGMLDLRKTKPSFGWATLMASTLVAPLACSSYVAYEGTDQSPIIEEPTSDCFSSQPSPKCQTECLPSVDQGSSCSLEGQICTRLQGECQFQAICSDGIWFGTTTCFGGPPPPGECSRCQQFVTTPMPAPICNDSAAFLKELVSCLCDHGSMDPVPGCKDVCGDNLCLDVNVTAMATPECATCVQSGPCKEAVMTCLQDN